MCSYMCAYMCLQDADHMIVAATFNVLSNNFAALIDIFLHYSHEHKDVLDLSGLVLLPVFFSFFLIENVLQNFSLSQSLSISLSLSLSHTHSLNLSLILSLSLSLSLILSFSLSHLLSPSRWWARDLSLSLSRSSLSLSLSLAPLSRARVRARPLSLSPSL